LSLEGASKSSAQGDTEMVRIGIVGVGFMGIYN
jgi:hypothetical protein